MLSELNQTQVPLPWQEAQWQSVVAALKSGRSGRGGASRSSASAMRSSTVISLSSPVIWSSHPSPASPPGLNTGLCIP